MRERADPSLTLSEAAKNPDAYKGRWVVWGGEIVRLLPQDDGRIFIEILQLPLGWRGRPSDGPRSEGKFLMLARGGFDLFPFKEGRKITVAGQIEGAVQGKSIGNVSEPGRQYVLIRGEEFRLWEGLFSPHSSVPPPRDPWWYDPSQREPRF
jgi:starvation-inducible outer membrane lipoprotein